MSGNEVQSSKDTEIVHNQNLHFTLGMLLGNFSYTCVLRHAHYLRAFHQ